MHVMWIDEETADVTQVSPFSRKTHIMRIKMKQADLKAWINGKTIQDALPYLTADEREFLMTGITAEEWDKYMK